MTDQPPGAPWRGQHRVPPPPPILASPAATVESPVARAHRWWARLDPLPKALLILAAAAALPLFLCFGGVAMVAVSHDDPPPDAALATSPEPAGLPTPSASPSPSPTVVTRIVTQTAEIPFEEVVVEDSSLLEGTEEVRAEGAVGELTITFEVTITDGEETDRRKLKERVTRDPVDQVIAVGTRQPQPEPEPEPEPEAGSNCHQSYTGPCVPANVSDVDCAGGSGNGPAYVDGPVYVVGPDVYDLDRDGDGVACE